MTTWADYLMGAAEHASCKSKDNTKVGAVLVRDRAVLLTAFNGPPAGVVDSHDRLERPRKYLFASHAEQNLIAFAARHGIRTEGCSVYVTHAPCAGCAKSLIQAGISEIVYDVGQTSMPEDEFQAARVMLGESGVRMASILERRRCEFAESRT